MKLQKVKAVLGKLLRKIWKSKEALFPYLGIVVLTLLFGLTTNGVLFSSIGLRNMVNQSLTMIILTAGSMFVYAHGSLDISQGALVGLGALVFTQVSNASGSLLLGGLAMLVLIVACAAMIGFVTTTFGLPSFIASLCVMLAGKGILTLATLETPFITLNGTGFHFLRETWVKVAAILLVCVVCYILFEYTRIGRYNKIIGGNRTAAEQMGISVRKYVILAFVVSGIMTTVAALFYVTRTANVSSSTGEGLELNAMIALMLGGMPLSGGSKARISNAITGSILISLLTYGLTLWGADVLVISLIKGVIFLAVTSITFKRSGKLLPR